MDIINLLLNKNLCIKLVLYQDYTEMNGQKNIKRVTGTLHKEQYTFMIIFSSVILIMRNVEEKL